MALEDVLARLPGIAGWEAANQQSLKQALGLGQLLTESQQMALRRAQEQRIQQMVPHEIALQEAKLGEYQRKAEEAKRIAAARENAKVGLQGLFPDLPPEGGYTNAMDAGVGSAQMRDQFLGLSPGTTPQQETIKGKPNPMGGLMNAMVDLDQGGISDIAKALVAKQLGIGASGIGAAPMVTKLLADAEAAKARGDMEQYNILMHAARTTAMRYNELQLGRYQGLGFPEQQRQAELADTGVSGLPRPGQQQIPPLAGSQPTAPQAGPAQVVPQTAPQAPAATQAPNPQEDAIVSEIGAAHYRLAQYTRAGDQNGVARERQNIAKLSGLLAQQPAASTQNQPIQQQPATAQAAASTAPPQSATLSPRDIRTIERETQKEGSTETAKHYAKAYSEAQTKAQTAQYDIQKYRRIDKLLGDFEGGKFSQAGYELQRALNSMGIKTDNLPNKEAAESMSKEIALALRAAGPVEGTVGMPGNMSDADRDFLSSMAPQMSQTAAGRKMIIETVVKLRERQIEIAAMARQWLKTHGHKDWPGFGDVVDKYMQDNPIYGGKRNAPELVGLKPEPLQVNNEQDFAKVRAGEEYIDPNGVRRTKRQQK